MDDGGDRGDASFAAKGTFLKTHGVDEVHDLKYWRSAGDTDAQMESAATESTADTADLTADLESATIAYSDLRVTGTVTLPDSVDDEEAS